MKNKDKFYTIQERIEMKENKERYETRQMIRRTQYLENELEFEKSLKLFNFNQLHNIDEIKVDDEFKIHYSNKYSNYLNQRNRNFVIDVTNKFKKYRQLTVGQKKYLNNCFFKIQSKIN